MQYSQEHLKTIVYEKFWGQTECIMGNWKIENSAKESVLSLKYNYCHCIHNGPVTASSPVSRDHFLGDMNLGKKACGGGRACKAETQKLL